MISFSGRTLSLTIRQRCSSVTVDLCHTCSGGGISAIGEKRDEIGARDKFLRWRKTPNPTTALKTGGDRGWEAEAKKIAAARKDLIAGGEDEGAWCECEASRPLPLY